MVGMVGRGEVKGGENYQSANSHACCYGRDGAGADVTCETTAGGEEGEEVGCLGGVGLRDC